MRALLLLLHLQQQRTVDVRQDTTKSNRRADKGVELFVTADGKLQVTWRNALDFEILGSVACELEDFGSEVFENGGQVYGGFGTDARLLAGDGTEVTLYATAGELWCDVALARCCCDVRQYGGVPCARRLLTCRPAFAECDFVVLTCESPFPPVLPPVFPKIRISVTAPLLGRVVVSGAYLYRRP